MFKRMNNNIYISLLSTASLLVTIIITLSVIMVSDIVSANYIDMAEQKLERSISRSKNYVDSVLLTAGNIASDASLVSELVSPRGMTFTSMLNNSCNYATKTDAITVYAADGRILSSSGISDIPTLDILDTDPYIHDFFTDARSEYISMRTDAIAGIYGNAPYDTAAGMITCCKKIYNGDEVVGYVFSDIFPSNVYEYFDWSAEEYFAESIPFINRGDGYLPYGGNSSYADEFEAASYASRRTSDGRYLIIPSNRNFFGCAVSVAVPLYPLYGNVAVIGAMLAATGIAILVGVHFAAKALANSIDKRLKRIHDRMDSEGFGTV